jgi:hypothetical protein
MMQGSRVPPLGSPLTDKNGMVMPGPWPVFFQPAPSDFAEAGDSSGALALDLSKAAEFFWTLTGDVTVQFDNPADGGRYVFWVATGSGSHGITWPANVRWSGTAPTVTAAGGKVDLFVFAYLESLGLFFGAANQNYPAT